MKNLKCLLQLDVLNNPLQHIPDWLTELEEMSVAKYNKAKVKQRWLKKHGQQIKE